MVNTRSHLPIVKIRESINQGSSEIMKKPWKCECGEWNWAKVDYCEKCNKPKKDELVNPSFANILAKLKETT